jgi:hypothetical protein
VQSHYTWDPPAELPKRAKRARRAAARAVLAEPISDDEPGNGSEAVSDGHETDYTDYDSNAEEEKDK